MRRRDLHDVNVRGFQSDELLRREPGLAVDVVSKIQSVNRLSTPRPRDQEQGRVCGRSQVVSERDSVNRCNHNRGRGRQT